MKKIFLVLLISLIVLTGCESKKEENLTKIVENNGMLSYTIDGEIAKEKPTKESGYFVNSIKCDNGSILVWDNDNWIVELVEPKGSDRCIVDFTKNISNPGYRVTATSNIENVLDSHSKATTNGGTVEIYTKNEIEIKSINGCTGTIENNKAVITNVTQNQMCNIEIEPTLANYVKLAYKPQPGRTDFSKIDNGTPEGSPEGQTGGLYKGADNQGITYYFSGDGTSMKNWVSFAGSMWRIIRINGNGSVRLLYAGDGDSPTDIGKKAFNSSYHPSFVGWKYTNSSTFSDNRKNTLEGDRENGTTSGAFNAVNSWYTTNIIDVGLTNYIDTNAIYCNDRELASGNIYSTSSSFNYAAYERLISTSPNPIFNCSNNSDRFTTFGLMTADEVVYAGGKFSLGNSKAYYYLAKDGMSSITAGSSLWWTMSPYNWNNDERKPYIFLVNGRDGGITRDYTSILYLIRPVISLKKEVLVTGGDGSAENPYEVTI